MFALSGACASGSSKARPVERQDAGERDARQEDGFVSEFPDAAGPDASFDAASFDAGANDGGPLQDARVTDSGADPCSAGYERRGISCVDIDECARASDDRCDEHATCRNTPGSYTCMCGDGFEGDGFTCTVAVETDVLVYYDSRYGSGQVPSVNGVALAGRATTSVTLTTSDFELAYDRGGFGAIIVEASGSPLSVGMRERLVSWIDAGGRLILNYYDLSHDATLQTAFGVTATNYTTWKNVVKDPASPVDLFAAPESLLSTMVCADSGAFDNGDSLSVVGDVDGFLAARLMTAAGLGAIAVTRSGRVVVHGFLAYDCGTRDNDGDSKLDMAELYANELAYLSSL